MKRSALAVAVVSVVSLVAVAEGHAETAPAGTAAAPATLDTMIVTGTRGSNRTQFDTLAPVDVFSKQEIQAIESSDLNDVLAQLVPSFVVQRMPMNDGLVFVRPATLRGLSPDQTLVLVNGRRFHRSALLGARGAQGPDLAQIPLHAIQRIEVLRDGASAQYGSDAIAGVINIILDDSVGGEVSLGLSEYSAGDGRGRKVGARHGFALGDTGSLSLFADWDKSDATSRSRQRADAIAFQKAHPDLAVPDPVQRWGQPDLENRHFGFNLNLPLNARIDLYSFGLYGHSEGVSDFNWRNPDGTASVYNPSRVFPGWNVRSVYPTGFSPKYGNEQDDLQGVLGLRGTWGERWRWDVSGSYGRNRIDYTLGNSINASLGPASPTAFYLGRLSQQEKNLNADIVYALPVSALAAPINIAFGAETREETYGVDAGDPASYAIGPGAVTGLAGGANGAPGFSAANAGRWSQRSRAAYIDVEAPLTARWTVGAATRYEHFSAFGESVDGKLSTRFEFTPGLAVRGSVSTGFRAPTPGQLFTQSTQQGLDTVTLQVFTTGRLSPGDPLAIQLGAQPLKPEQSRTASLGLTWKTALGFSGSVDVYDIKVTDRFSQSASFAVPAGVPNPLGYTSVSFYTNDFDTTTRGIDVVASHAAALGAGRLNTTLGYNYNQTRVDGGRTGVATNDSQRRIFEERLPEHKATLSSSYELGRWSLLGKLRYYGAWTDSSGNATGDIFQRFGAMAFFDLAVALRVTDQQTLRIGADNLFDRYPDQATFQASRGLIYSRNAPYDTDGRNVYAEYRIRY
ncbi:TonB-dependent receptor plug domain-containing protein [Stenotrophomonas rhizophila]|uniref:TonB-dependent receptor plug domain-containing protein n=1 Tax=Stenotrophomonas rhizophila TaxID=216778 RepID=UPI003D18999C